MAGVASLLGSAASTWAAVALGSGTPVSWGAGALAAWLAFVASRRGWAGLQRADRYQLAWGLASTAGFHAFLLMDPSFRAWGDVYYYCGERMQYCTCDLSWNLRGWCKAAVLWSFILSSALAVQKLVIQAGLRGLLPGEEVVTKESFVSICWRLIPYQFNAWEQQWGAETSSMMFELPHFSIELLVVLPCVQILCSRLRVLTLPAAHPLWPEILAAQGGRGGRRGRDRALAPDAIQGIWRHMPDQHRLLPRLRANLRMLLMVAAVTTLASFNALHTPLALEAQIHAHPRSPPLAAAAATCGASPACWAGADLGPASAAALRAHAAACPAPEPLARALRKHGREVAKMAGPAHGELIPLVEAALAVMRLSCERYFALLSLFAAYLAWHGGAPAWARRLVRLNARLSRLFQAVILNAFPAVCWLYGAGALFSAFVSAVFWGGAARRAAGRLRALASVVEPQGMQDASEEQVERMNASCAICWGEMAAAGRGAGPGAAGRALPCGHAFHGPCIQRWLKQCHGQARQPTCPLCNRAILLQVSYRLPLRLRRAPRPPPPPPEAPQQAAAEAAPGAQRQERQAGAPAPAAGTSAPVVPRLPTQALEGLGGGGQQPARGVGQGERAARGAEAGPSGQAAPAGGQQTQRSAPPWPQGPSLPVSLAPGVAPTSERGRARWRCRPGGPRAALRAGGSGEAAAAQPPAAFAPSPARSPQAASGTSTQGGAAEPELSAAAVRRDLQRSRAHLDFIAAQEAQMQATIERCSGAMAEAWQTARELLGNAEQLEHLLGRQQLAGAEGAGDFAELWRRQQRLWQRAQELHREGAAFTGP